MPELPDLHVFSRNLHARLAGKVVNTVRLGKTRRRNFSNARILSALAGHALDEVYREGKEVHFRFANGNKLGVHLMLAGQFDIAHDPDPIAFARLAILFESGEWLVVSDPRAWAVMTLNPKPARVPDALSVEFNMDYLSRRLRQSPGIRIKAFLTDQSNVRGIGNAYADEILWACRIAPQSLCEFLPVKKTDDLCHAIRSVLTNAISEIERVAPGAINGEARDFLKIHNPAITHSPSGFPMLCETLGGKKTYYCSEQTLYCAVAPFPTGSSSR